MATFFQYLMVGLGSGAIYAMLGLSLVVVYRATGLLNFAQGEIAMISTFLTWTFHDLGLPLALALLASIVVSFGIGAAIHQSVIRPLGDPHEKPLQVVIVTIGLFLGLNALAQLIWGTDQRPFPRLFGDGEVDVLGVIVDWQSVGALATLAVEALVFWLLFTKTKLGLAMRSVANNSESSGLSGIPVGRILMLGWGLAAAVGAVAGAFAAPDRALDTNLMLLPLIYAFAAITLGGFDSLVGAIVGGLIVGVVTEVVPKYVSAVESVPLAPAFLMIIAVLLFWPQGLFGSSKVQRV